MQTVTYGHGTENDFLLLFDEQNQFDVQPERIANLCSRTGSVGRPGADGLIRITRNATGKNWFMDYRNSDGSLAEMCGNGIRVMARYLVDRGHQGAGIFAIDTRDGLKYLAVPEVGEISVNMGKVLDLSDVDGTATILQSGNEWKSFNINVGNPHAVAIISDLAQVGDLTTAPGAIPDDIYPEGVNIEFAQIIGDNEVLMRVYERGSGETRSCGTGICAVALAANVYSKRSLPAKWIINPPGGRLTVELDPHSNATLTGAAVILQDFEVEI